LGEGPNPTELNRVKVDRYSRTVYDRVPEPPPFGLKGADRITILEGTDGVAQSLSVEVRRRTGVALTLPSRKGQVIYVGRE